MRNPLAEMAKWPAARRARFLASLDADELRELEVLSETLLEFIPRVSPRLEAPEHLRPLTDLLEATTEAPQSATVSTPPQHGKSETCKHALIWLLRRDPTRRHAYVTYEATRAERQNEELQRIADRAGLKWTGNRTMWRTAQGGGVVAAGIGGPLTGEPVDGVMLVDDPVKNQVEASSSLLRDRVDEWFKTVAITRCHPSASKIVVQTRWHEDDLSGRLIKREGWGRINLPAVATEQKHGRKVGEPLWSKGRPLDFLLGVKRDVGEYIWAALYQGEPRPRGGTVFEDATLYVELPRHLGFRIGIGVDLAYSKRTHADYSVAVVLMRVPNPLDVKRPLYYVLDVRREQVRAPAFKSTLRGLRQDHPTAPMRWYAGGTEQGVGDFIQEPDGDLPVLPLQVLPPNGDKFIRAQPVAAAWNEGRVLVPEGAPWAAKFIAEVTTFTGVNDAHDDQVDALAAAYDELVNSWTAEPDDAYEGFKPRFSGSETPTEDAFVRPASHATDVDRIKRSGRW